MLKHLMCAFFGLGKRLGFVQICSAGVIFIYACFFCRLNALEYSDLRNKVQSPIRNARNIVVRQSLSDRFLQAFTEQVMSNNIFQKSENMVST